MEKINSGLSKLVRMVIHITDIKITTTLLLFYSQFKKDPKRVKTVFGEYALRENALIEISRPPNNDLVGDLRRMDIASIILFVIGIMESIYQNV